MHRLCALEHTERSEQTDQTKTVVAVQVRDEDVIESPGMNAEFLHRQQRSFAAIDEERFVTQLHQLARRRGGLGRLGAAAS